MPIYRSRDFTALSPTYTDISQGIAGALVGMLLDPFAPKYRAFSLTADGVWRTNNLEAEAPGWAQMLAISSKIAASRNPALVRAQATIAQQNRIYALAWALSAPDASTYKQYLLKTDDNGLTWSSAADTGASGSGDWQFASGVEGWVADAGGASEYWSGGALCIESPWGWLDGGWSYSFPVGQRPVAQTGQTFGVNITRGPNFFHNVRIYYADGSYDANSYNFGGTYTLTATVSAGNNGKDIASLWTGGSINDSSGVASIHYASTTIPVGSTNMDAIGLAVGQHNSDKVYTSGLNTIQVSSDGGSSFSLYIPSGAYDVECHYAGNPSDDDLRFIGVDGQFYTTAGATPTARAGWGTETPISVAGRIVTFVADVNLIYTLFHDGGNSFSVKRSTDGGATWSTRSSGHAGARAIGLWPSGAGDTVFMVTDAGPVVSTDGGATFADKLGDLVGWADPVYIVPAWIS